MHPSLVLRAAALALLAAAPAAPLAAQAASAPPRPAAWAPLASGATAFVDVSVIPMDGERVLANQTVVVADGRIVAMGPAASTPVPAGAARVDGRGKFLAPGLIDMHAHFPQGAGTMDDGLGRSLALFTATGVTTVRGLIAPPQFLAQRERARTGELVSPALIVAGPSLNGQSVSSVNVGRVMVDDAADAGFDLLKTHGGISAEIYDTIAAAAKRRGLPLSGHVTPGYGLARATAAGQQIEHLDGFLAAALPEGVQAPPGQFIVDPALLAQIDTARFRVIAREQRAAGICNGPTLSLFRGIVGGETADVLAARPEMRYAPPQAVAQWSQQKGQFLANYGPGPERFLALRDQLVRTLHAEGAKIIASSDSPQFFLVPGFALHRELEALSQAGLPAHAVLASATSTAAECLGPHGADIGTVAVGKRADLLLLAANPLQDLRTLQAPAGVMMRGRYFPAQELEAMREAVAASAARVN